MDLASILLGLVAGAIPCLVWVMQVQRRQGARQGEQALLEERLNAAQLAQAGDAVLMSPACASLDMFRDYKHRADVFVDAVRELAAEHGADLEGTL